MRTPLVAVVPVMLALALSGCGLLFGGAEPGDGGAAGANDAGSPDGGASAVDSGLPPGCRGLAITTDGVLDVDLGLVRISGAVTLNGAVLPAASGSRGALVFTHRASRTAVSVPLPAGGPGQYGVALAPGVYDLAYAANPAWCVAAQPSPVPCTGGPLLQGVSLTTDGALDVDLPAVTVSGRVTLNGADLPSQSTSRGQLAFLRQDGTPAFTRSLGTTGAATYQVMLLRGAYTVGYQPEGTCDGRVAPRLPCNSGVLATSDFTASGSLDVDLRTISLSGRVTVRGADLPAATGSRGALVFGLQGGTSASVPLATSGAVTYALTLMPGTYTVGFAGNPQLCDAATAPPVPCNSGPLTTVALTASGALDLDVPLVKVSGAVTLDGAAFPSATVARGRLGFTLGQGSTLTSRSLGTAGGALYQVSLLPGAYGLSFVANPASCDGKTVPRVPCASGLLSTATLSADGALDVDLPSVVVTGQVTLQGQALPDLPGSRGALTFTAQALPGATVDLGRSGAVAYALRLLKGSHTLTYLPGGVCDGKSAPAMPCTSGELQRAQLTADGNLDVDVPVVKVSGAVTLRGQPLPNLPASRGQLDFLRSDGSASAPLGSTGAGTYGLALLPGDYVVRHDANRALCDGLTAGPFPCTGQLLLGCSGP